MLYVYAYKTGRRGVPLIDIPARDGELPLARGLGDDVRKCELVSLERLDRRMLSFGCITWDM